MEKKQKNGLLIFPVRKSGEEEMPEASSEKESPASSRRCLESWKQIADYLNCSERTARRYQTIGLPVYRRAALDHQRVFAYTDELDHWLHTGGGESLVKTDARYWEGSTDKDRNKLDQFSKRPKGSASSSDRQLCLEVVGGSDAGSRYPMKGSSALLGREISATVVLADMRISRRHAVVERSGSDFLLEDLGSRNGTTLNGKAVTARVALKHGDKISLGGAVLFQVQIVCPGETVEIS